jgi:mono/diheme cytochrome c family protein
MIIKRLLLLLLVSTHFTATAGEHPQNRWYTQEQVAQGAPLYAKFCAECHGPKAASTTEWRKQDAEGYYPAPPLNGTAHTWHHQLPLLQRTIREGGAKFGGKMPPFADKLNAAEVDAIIAWFQSLWPEKTYTTWSGRSMSHVPQPDFMKNLPK